MRGLLTHRLFWVQEVAWQPWKLVEGLGSTLGNKWINKYFKDTSKPPYWRRITIYISSFFKTSWALMNWLSLYETASGWLIVEQHHAFETSLKTWFLFSCNLSPYFFQAYQLLKHLILTWRTCGSCQFIEIIVRIHHSRQWLFWKKETIL